MWRGWMVQGDQVQQQIDYWGSRERLVRSRGDAIESLMGLTVQDSASPSAMQALYEVRSVPMQASRSVMIPLTVESQNRIDQGDKT
jgi:hypothetical protein